MPQITRELAQKQAKERLAEYLQQLGIYPYKPFRCLNPAHEDKNPSMSFDVSRNRVHCFACGQNYDIFQLVGMIYRLERFPEQVQKACDLLGIELPSKKQTTKTVEIIKDPYTMRIQQYAFNSSSSATSTDETIHVKNTEDIEKYCAKARLQIDKTSYPAQRGLSHSTCARFGLGFDPCFTHGTGISSWQALIIPTGEASYTARNTDPTAEKKNRIRKYGKSPLFGMDILFSEGPPVFIVEGEIDALSIYEVGGEAVALGSTANVQRFLSVLERRLSQRTLLIAMDDDDEGQRAADALCEGLSMRNVHYHRVSLSIVGKDANDALLADRDGFASLVHMLSSVDVEVDRIARETYESTCVENIYDSFLQGLSRVTHTPAVKTGFLALDRVLEGGFYEGLIIVGAISSIGKTTFALQIADQAALMGQDVLFFSLEMSRQELLAKSLSRMTLDEVLLQKTESKYAKTVRGLLDASRWHGYTQMDRKIIQSAADRYRPATKHLFIREGVGEIGVKQVRDQIDEHIRFTGRMPFVIIDYLQILLPNSERLTDKQNMDRTVLALKRISRDYALPILAISSFNRANYREAVTMEAFKESGAIEYSSDLLLGLQLSGAGTHGFDPMLEKEKDPRQIDLVILKNRNGPVGKHVFFDYYPRFNCFIEKDEKNEQSR